jgi:hypothetical protein
VFYLIAMVASLVARNANEAMVALMVEAAFGGSLKSGDRLFAYFTKMKVGLFVGAFCRNVARVAVKMLLHLFTL